MFAAVTDHVFLDGGHTIDFTNKAFEVLDHLGWEEAADVLADARGPDGGGQPQRGAGCLAVPPRPRRHDRRSHRRAPRAARGAAPATASTTTAGVAKLAWSILSDDPAEVVAAIDDAIDAGATPEELGRAVAYAAALRITRFHTQNDHGDWDEVHHAFTAANAAAPGAPPRADHRAAARRLPRGAAHLPRPLPQRPRRPAPRQPPRPATPSTSTDLQGCWDQEGRVDDAGAIVYRYLSAGGDPGQAIAALGHALLTEDAEFHWFQTYEAAVRQFHAWPAGPRRAR